MKRVFAFCLDRRVVLLTSDVNAALAEDDPHAHGKVFATCAKACAECMNSCNSCYHHCATLVSEGNKDHTKTMTSCNDCAENCAMAAKLTAAQPVCRHDLRSLREDVRRMRRGLRPVSPRRAHGRVHQSLSRLCRGLPRDDQADGRLILPGLKCRTAP